jgi:hypothetical protein
VAETVKHSHFGLAVGVGVRVEHTMLARWENAATVVRKRAYESVCESIWPRSKRSGARVIQTKR